MIWLVSGIESVFLAREEDPGNPQESRLIIETGGHTLWRPHIPQPVDAPKNNFPAPYSNIDSLGHSILGDPILNFNCIFSIRWSHIKRFPGPWGNVSEYKCEGID